MPINFISKFQLSNFFNSLKYKIYIAFTMIKKKWSDDELTCSHFGTPIQII